MQVFTVLAHPRRENPYRTRFRQLPSAIGAKKDTALRAPVELDEASFSFRLSIPGVTALARLCQSSSFNTLFWLPYHGCSPAI